MPEIKTISHSENALLYQNCVWVHTYPKPTDNSITLACIEHRFENANSDYDTDDSRATRVIVDAQPMSHERAMDLATYYAKDKGVPLILVTQDKGGVRVTDIVQTNTVVLDKNYPEWVKGHWDKNNVGVDKKNIDRGSRNRNIQISRAMR